MPKLHFVQLRTETAWRHDHLDDVRKVPLFVLGQVRPLYVTSAVRFACFDFFFEIIQRSVAENQLDVLTVRFEVQSIVIAFGKNIRPKVCYLVYLNHGDLPGSFEQPLDHGLGGPGTSFYCSWTIRPSSTAPFTMSEM